MASAAPPVSLPDEAALLRGQDSGAQHRPRPAGDDVTGPALRDLPRALDDDGLRNRLAGRRPALFLDYDGVLTPIVDRPEDAVISEGARDTVRDLSLRCPV